MSDFLPVLLRALVLGAFGGAGLALTQIYSRRGPLIFPVYAALLAALALLLSRFEVLSYLERFIAVFAATVVAALISLVTVLVLSARERRRLAESGRAIGPGGAPWWGLPLVLGLLLAASAGVAFIAS